jgi:hypothetical protein
MCLKTGKHFMAFLVMECSFSQYFLSICSKLIIKQRHLTSFSVIFD